MNVSLSLKAKQRIDLGYLPRKNNLHLHSENVRPPEQGHRPGTETHRGRKPWMLSKGQNWKNKNLTSRVTHLPLAYHWSGGLNSLTFSFLKITLRPHLYFSSRPRKAAKLDKWHLAALEPATLSNDPPDPHPGPGTDQSVESTTFKEHTWKADEYPNETSPTISTSKRDKYAQNSAGSPTKEHAIAIPPTGTYPQLLRDLMRLTTRRAMSHGSSSLANPLSLSSRPLFILVSVPFEYSHLPSPFP
uniref:Uncharacterized protein n=1 Tax=Myotis myotis TaxID=51298 RepID=A0A7J7TTN4_MYOMY|nr:hypothetical protein mMyoMyo1_008947 [Myotis myotis]